MIRPSFIVGVLALLQSAPQTTTPPAPSASDEIVVTGLRDLEQPGSVATKATMNSQRTGQRARASHLFLVESERFARCAIDDSPVVRSLLRRTLDGAINSVQQRNAQERLVAIRSGCALDPNAAREQIGRRIVYRPYDSSYYDRGAMFIEAIRRFAPDLQLTRNDTSDPAVNARFNAREMPLARARLPMDRRYYDAATCFVRLQPDLSTRLVKASDSSESVQRLGAAIVNRARRCVGNPKHVYFDPSQLRMYIADAVYRWAVAARAVDSLIPENG